MRLIRHDQRVREILRFSSSMGQPRPDDLEQADSPHIGHDHVGQALRFVELEDPQQRRAVQARSALGLAAELGQPVRLPRQRRDSRP